MDIDSDDLLIRQAIEQSLKVSLTYNGVKLRNFEQLHLIEHKITRCVYLMAYQWSGYSETSSSGWKIMYLYSIYSVLIQDVEYKEWPMSIPAWANEITIPKKKLIKQPNKGVK